MSGGSAFLFVCRCDGLEAETLPRPVVEGRVLKMRQNVVGVAGGFVVEAHHDERRFLVHYDLANRSVRCHEVSKVGSDWGWFYYRDLHVIMLYYRGASPISRTEPGTPVFLRWRSTSAYRSKRRRRAPGRSKPCSRRNQGSFPYRWPQRCR